MKIYIAKTYKQKLKGLLGEKNINYGMLFPNVNSIHTCFMKESIDVLGLDDKMIVKEKHNNVKPFKVIFLKKSVHTLELPLGQGNLYNIGDKVEI